MALRGFNVGPLRVRNVSLVALLVLCVAFRVSSSSLSLLSTEAVIVAKLDETAGSHAAVATASTSESEEEWFGRPTPFVATNHPYPTPPVTYDACGRPLCPAKPAPLPPLAYVCDCSKPFQHVDCGCDRDLLSCDCNSINVNPQCGCNIRTSPVAVVCDCNSQEEPHPACGCNRIPKLLRHKIKPYLASTSTEADLPPMNQFECRPNVHEYGPGTCSTMGVDNDDHCSSGESNCQRAASRPVCRPREPNCMSEARTQTCACAESAPAPCHCRRHFPRDEYGRYVDDSDEYDDEEDDHGHGHHGRHHRRAHHRRSHRGRKRSHHAGAGAAALRPASPDSECMCIGEPKCACDPAQTPATPPPPPNAGGASAASAAQQAFAMSGMNPYGGGMYNPYAAGFPTNCPCYGQPNCPCAVNGPPLSPNRCGCSGRPRCGCDRRPGHRMGGMSGCACAGRKNCPCFSWAQDPRAPPPGPYSRRHRRHHRRDSDDCVCEDEHDCDCPPRQHRRHHHHHQDSCKCEGRPDCMCARQVKHLCECDGEPDCGCSARSSPDCSCQGQPNCGCATESLPASKLTVPGTGAVPPPVMPGAMPGAMPGVMPGAMPGVMPGAMPGAMPGSSLFGVPMPGTPGIPGVPPLYPPCMCIGQPNCTCAEQPGAVAASATMLSAVLQAARSGGQTYAVNPMNGQPMLTAPFNQNNDLRASDGGSSSLLMHTTGTVTDAQGHTIPIDASKILIEPTILFRYADGTLHSTPEQPQMTQAPVSSPPPDLLAGPNDAELRRQEEELKDEEKRMRREEQREKELEAKHEEHMKAEQEFEQKEKASVTQQKDELEKALMDKRQAQEVTEFAAEQRAEQRRQKKDQAKVESLKVVKK